MKLILQISHPCLQSSSKQNLQKLLILKLKFKKFVHFSFDETHKLSACEESQELPENNSTVIFFCYFCEPLGGSILSNCTVKVYPNDFTFLFYKEFSGFEYKYGEF